MNLDKPLGVLSLGVALLLAMPAGAQENVPVHFAKGASSATLQGRIQGYHYRDYRLSASAGQVMTVSMQTTNTAAYFNVLPPGSSDAADFIGSTSGNRYAGTLAKSGSYTVRVYLMRSAARRNESADYTLDVSITGHAATRPAHAMGHARPDDAKVEGTPYHATGKLPCSLGNAPAGSAQCDFGVIRGRIGYAEVHLTPPGGFERVLYFEGGKVSADNARVNASEQGDTWSVEVNDYEHYQIPEAVISGG